MHVDEETDINRVMDYFSYEHFYVLYCKFFELDGDKDSKLTRNDLLKYQEHSLSDAIVDRFDFTALPLSMLVWSEFLLKLADIFLLTNIFYTIINLYCRLTYSYFTASSKLAPGYSATDKWVGLLPRVCHIQTSSFLCYRRKTSPRREPSNIGNTSSVFHY